MKFNISKADLLDALTVVMKGVSTRSTLPILSGVLVETTQQGSVMFQSTNLEISIRHIQTADIVNDGGCVVPGKLLSDIVRALPDAAVTVESADHAVNITCMGSSFKLSTLPLEDFPRFSEPDVERTVHLDASLFERSAGKVVHAVSRDESRALLTGVLFSVEEGDIRFVATDSYRLALVDVEHQDGVEDFKAVIPGKTLDDVARIAGSCGHVSIGFSDNQVVFSFGSTTFVSRRIEGTYPNYGQLLPKAHALEARVDASTLVKSIKRAALLAQAHTPVRMSFSGEVQSIEIGADTQDVGNAVEQVDAAIEGGDMEIGFNHQYLLDGLAPIDGEAVIELQEPLKPGILRSAEPDGYLYLAMPVRLG